MLFFIAGGRGGGCFARDNFVNDFSFHSILTVEEIGPGSHIGGFFLNPNVLGLFVFFKYTFHLVDRNRVELLQTNDGYIIALVCFFFSVYYLASNLLFFFSKKFVINFTRTVQHSFYFFDICFCIIYEFLKFSI